MGWRRSTGVQVVRRRRRAAALQRAVAAESGGGGGDPGESEMDGGALVVSRLVTVLVAVLNREV